MRSHGSNLFLRCVSRLQNGVEKFEGRSYLFRSIEMIADFNFIHITGYLRL